MRKKLFKKGLDPAEFKKKREDSAFSVRKQKRQEQIMKRRNIHEHTDLTVEDIPKLASDVLNSDPKIQFEAVVNIRKLLAGEINPPIDQVISAGILPTLVGILKIRNHPNPKMQFEAAWAITNIASGTSEQTLAVLHCGAVEVFVEILRTGIDMIKEQAVWALGNIAGDSSSCRDFILQLQVIPYLIQLTGVGVPQPLRKNAVWTISNLCRGRPAPVFSFIRITIPYLVQLLHDPDSNIVGDALWALSYITDGDNERIEEVLKFPVAEIVVPLLLHKLSTVYAPALRVVGNISTGEDRHTQAILDAGVIPRLRVLLEGNSKGIIREVCWALSNITAGTPNQIQFIFDEPGLVIALRDLLHIADFAVKKEATWALANITSTGSLMQVKALIDNHCLPPLCALLYAPDARLVYVALEAINNVIVRGESLRGSDGINPFITVLNECGRKQLEGLARHPNQTIFDRARLIVQKLADDDVLESLAPPKTDSAYTFQVPQNSRMDTDAPF